MVESFLITLAELPGNFPKSCLGQLFCRVLANPKSVKEDFTVDVVSRIIQNFKNMQGWRLQFLGLWFTKKDFHYRAPFSKFSKHPSDIWFRSSFSVALRTRLLAVRLLPRLKGNFSKFQESFFSENTNLCRVLYKECRNFSWYFTKKWLQNRHSPKNFQNSRNNRQQNICCGLRFQHIYKW